MTLGSNKEYFTMSLMYVLDLVQAITHQLLWYQNAIYISTLFANVNFAFTTTISYIFWNIELPNFIISFLLFIESVEMKAC